MAHTGSLIRTLVQSREFSNEAMPAAVCHLDCVVSSAMSKPICTLSHPMVDLIIRNELLITLVYSQTAAAD